jgi:hypothetical protein
MGRHARRSHSAISKQSPFCHLESAIAETYSMRLAQTPFLQSRLCSDNCSPHACLPPVGVRASLSYRGVQLLWGGRARSPLSNAVLGDRMHGDTACRYRLRRTDVMSQRKPALRQQAPSILTTGCCQHSDSNFIDQQAAHTGFMPQVSAPNAIPELPSNTVLFPNRSLT